MSHLEDWLAAATNDGKVEHLNLLLLYPKSVIGTIFDTLFTCTTIVRLKLKIMGCVFPSVSIHLPSLKTLHLVANWCSESDVKNFLYGSPVLELFHLKQLSVIEELKIVRSPRHIRLFERRWFGSGSFYLVVESDGDYDFIPDYLEGHLENVVKAKVYITLCENEFLCIYSGIHSLNTYAFFVLKQLRNVEFLSLTDYRIKIDWPSTLDFPQFQNLVQLQLYLKDPHSVFVELPAKCPKLPVSSEPIITMDDRYDINEICSYHDISIVPI